MISDDYQVHNIYKYSRKSYKKNRRETQDNVISPHDINLESEESPRSDRIDSPVCECNPNFEISNLLIKKCPVINLAQEQLQRLLDETDKLLCENTDCCRSVFDFLILCKNYLGQDNCRYIMLILVGVSFLAGVISGAASCGTHLGRFNSPILTCIDNFFISSSYSNVENSFRAIV